MRRPSEIIANIEKNKETMEFIPTGFKLLDDFLDGGFLRQEMILLGAYTGVGKSFVSGSILYNIAQKGFKCGYFSLEISSEMIVSRILGQKTNIKPTMITSGVLEKNEKKSLKEAKAELIAYDNFIFIEDEIYELDDLEKEIKRSDFDFVIVDFIQNVFEPGLEYERLSKVALAFQRIAKEANLCLLALSQISNEAHKKGYLEYKGSGSIATVCDLGMFLKRAEAEENIDGVELEIRKNRRGPSGRRFALTFTQPGGALKETGTWI